MEIRIYIEKEMDIDIQEVMSKILFIKPDFNSLKQFMGDKEIMEQTFQLTKKEMIDG